MRKLRTKIGAMIASAMLAVAMMAMPAGAATTYTPVQGGTFEFDKYLVMKTDASVPNVSFSFTITPGNAGAAGSGIYAGNDARVQGNPEITGTAVFQAGDTTYDTVQDGDSVSLPSGHVYAVKQTSVSFANVSFKEPGIYTYIITETNSGVLGVTYDTTPKTLQVHVEDNNGVLRIGDGTNTGYVLYQGETNDKATGFTNEYSTHDLSVKKLVDGNQASKDEYFEFTVSLSGALPSTSYTVDLTDAQEKTSTNAINTTAHTNATTITTDAQGAASATYWLQNGQKILIKGLTNGVKYTVSENNTTLANEGYSASIAKDTDDPDLDVSAGHVASDMTSGITADTNLEFTNSKNGVIPTGVILSVAPWVIAGVVIIGGIVFFAIRSKKKYEEE